MMMRLMMMKMKRGMLARQMKMKKRYVLVLIVLVSYPASMDSNSILD